MRGEDIRGRFSALAQGLEGERVVALGKALSGGVCDKGTVIPQWRRETEGAVEQELAGGGPDEIGTANNFRDAHGGVIDDDGELVGGDIVSPPDEEVTEIATSDKALRAEVLVEELDGFSVGHSESPVHADGRCGGIGDVTGKRAAGSGVEGLIVFLRLRFVGCLCGTLEILAGTFAGIDGAGVEELLPGGEIEVAALALRVGSEGAADVGAFLPADSEPAQVFDHGLLEVGAGAMRIEIFVAKDEGAVCGETALIRGEESARVSQVEEACGRGGYAAAIGRGHGISLWEKGAEIILRAGGLLSPIFPVFRSKRLGCPSLP